MPFSLRTLRVLLGGAALLLVAGLAGYIALGRMHLGNPLKGLPRRFGVDVEQESDNFTYSQSLRGRTVYTIHASKEIQHKDGRITLRDVAMELFGVKGERDDRIQGHEFSYDQKLGVLRAIGPVFIDLAPPARPAAAGQPAARPDDAKRIHIVTSGLVFLEKEQNASTDEPVDFSAGGMTGHSVGASYDSGKGVVVLRSAVHVTGVRGERPLVLTAARAELDRDGNVARLEQAKYISAADSGPQSAAADHAVVHMDADGTPRHIDGDGHVTLAGSGRGTITGDHLQLELGPTSQPRQGHLFSHVAFHNEDPGHVGAGRADDARVSFDDAGRPRHVLLNGAVDLDQHAGQAERRLQAATVDLMLAGGGKQPSVVTAAKASAAAGSNDRAWLRLLDASTKGHDGEGTLATDIRAQTLTGRFAAQSKVTQLQGLDGTGQTEVERVARDARGQTESDETSRGDTLQLELSPGEKGRLELVRAAQHGHVESVRIAQGKAVAGRTAAAPDREQARADAEVYEAATDTVTLTGSVQMQNQSSALFADQARVDRRAGVSTATGAVRVSYASANAGADPGANAEPVHVVAAQAISTDATGVAVFTGGAGGKARMWQDASQVEAPEIELNRQKKTLLAHAAAGAHGGDAPLVRTIMVGADAPAGSADAAARQPAGPVRIVSRDLAYSDATREAVFTGRVRVDDADGTLMADQATAYLAQPRQAGQAAQATLLGGKLDHVVGIGHVTVQQPERTGTGEKIVYTAADQTFVLTGTRAVMPKVVDEERGTVTGAVLRFRSEDKTVFVEGDAANKRVRTETKLK